MNPSDKAQFKELCDGLCEAYSKDPMSQMGLRVYFEALKSYDLDQVITAASKHLADTKHGTFFPKVADLIRCIEGGEVTTDEVISAARLKNTPFGIMCRKHIGHWDLEHQTDMFYLKQRAQECIDLLPEWKVKAIAGEYSDHDISIMLKYGVNPTSPFRNGLPRPQNMEALKDRCKQIEQSPRHQFLIEKPYEETEGDKLLEADKSVSTFLAKLD
ncbi:MAG: hypothetical protein CMI54_04675 [Parcubacteria group bacterium]|nr:hypothetical protein [Parcubacteria group bacterium]|tara:strand:+ start:3512 stop:4156 length:645 start_codon:yes stop_codon:yes gene_type:complete